MPPKKKGSGRKTNKKKGNRTSSSSSSPTSTTPMSTSATSAYRYAPATAASALEGTLPDMSGFERRTPVPPEKYSSVYQCYKDATKRFVAYMEKQAYGFDGILPQKSTMSVNTLLTIADQMDSEGRTMDPLALRDLKLTIRMRTRVANSVFGGGDTGHQHFLTVLIYCWTVLAKLTRATTHDYATIEPINTNSSQDNRFGVFQEDIEDEELDDVDEEIFPSTVPRPEPEPEPLSLEELMNSNERHDAIAFLLSLDEIMGLVVEQYQAVCDNHRHLAHEIPQTNIVEMLIEASVATNMGIQQVQRLEFELSIQYPHLSTPYRLLATVALPDLIREITTILHEHGSKEIDDTEVVVFVGDCLEYTFRQVSDPNNRIEFIAPEICMKYNVDSHGSEKLQEVVKRVRMMTFLEVPLFVEEKNQILALSANLAPSVKSHSWLAHMPQISGGRAIHQTIRILQTFGDVIRKTPDDRQVIPIRGFFGPTWTQGRSSKLAGDMDELLMSDILAPFLLMFRQGILAKAELPMINDIAPLWVNLREYVRHPEKTVSWSLAFSVHALLTAILETDKISDSLMAISESVFEKFFSQLRWARNLVEDGPDSLIEDPKFRHKLSIVLCLRNLGLPVSAKRAIWNPLYAGTIFSYLSYFGNMEAGCSLVDSHAQLRIVMFVYHGLLINGIIKSGEIPFLDILYASFKNSRAVWEGPLPCRGEMVQRFWFCFGMNLVDSKRMAQEALRMYGSINSQGRSANGSGPLSLGRPRKTNLIKPEEICKSYRRICNHDFQDVVDKYHTEEQREREKHTDYYMLAVRANDTLDAIDEEQQLLSLNLSSCSIVLEQIVCGLIRACFLSGFLGIELDRQGAPFLIAQHLLGALDFSSDPINHQHQFRQAPLVLASSVFLTDYYAGINPANVVWFQAVKEEGDD